MASDRTVSNKDIYRALNETREYFAAGYFQHGVPDRIGNLEQPPLLRMALGIRNHLSRRELPDYDGQWIFPLGFDLWNNGAAFSHHYVKVGYSAQVCARKRKEATSRQQREALELLDSLCSQLPHAGGYTHSIPNYGRVLREGLNGYERRVRRGRVRRETESTHSKLYESLLICLEGIRILHRRIRASVEKSCPDTASGRHRRERLLQALNVVPFQPARSFYEALVSTHLMYLIDGNDNLGRFDQFLWPHYQKSRDAGHLTRDEALEMVEELWQHVDQTTGWNVALGGSRSEGEEATNGLTLLALEAGRGRRRPNLALRLREDTPDEIWDAAFDTIQTGCGLPALYCEENYRRALQEADLDISDEDLADYAFGGCTETMIHGCSNVGSLDGDINLPLHLVEELHQGLQNATDFEDFFGQYTNHLSREIRDLTGHISSNQRAKSEFYPQLIRTLLIDDCVDTGREYAAGGARYNWSVVNVVGLANVVDSLCALREMVFETREISAAGLLRALSADFKGHEQLRLRLEKCPRYGNGDEAADALAERLATFVFREFQKHQPWRGGKFLPACLMFVTYARFGKPVGATPDGRRAGEAVADSAGPYQGRDMKGPTAMLGSVARLPHNEAPGTLVVNIRLSKALFSTRDQRMKIKHLIRTYFHLGGMQLQINVVDQETLQDAWEHPEQHGDLIIRVGGYSEYWNRLDRDLQRTILNRTEHGCGV
jgi:formate C-acetyltransferase